jgi:Flp pilus assembly pilin Flp
MRNSLKKVLRDESGAVTVDWVVLTAAVAALSFVVIGILNSTGSVGDGLGDNLSTVTVGEE